jgi:cytidylate kinase
MTKPFVIAVDGPAASGKGTLSRRLATQYGLRHLDTGLSYRAVAQALMTAGQPLDDEALAVEAAKGVDFSAFDAAALSAHAVGEAASRVSVFSPVRRILVDKQRAFAEVAPGAVLDGRDIGTVVCPNADVKLYVTASPAVRAGRRHREILRLGGQADHSAILQDIERRDARDMGRADSPLRPAADAHLLDTSELSIEAAFLAACAIVDEARSARN